MVDKGVWRTIGGKRVFIADGQSLSEAMRKSGKFQNSVDKDDLKSLETEFKQFGTKLEEYAKYASPGKTYDEAKSEQYYRYKSKYEELRKKISEQKDKGREEIVATNSQKKINGYGEATSREITSLTYKRLQKRLKKDVDSFVGGR